MQPKNLLAFFIGANKIKASSASNLNAFTSPLGETSIHAGQIMELTWDEPSGERVDLLLMKGDPLNLESVTAIATGIPNQGSIPWKVPDTVAPGKYAVKIDASNGLTNFSPFFTIYDPVSPVKW